MGFKDIIKNFVNIKQEKLNCIYPFILFYFKFYVPYVNCEEKTAYRKVHPPVAKAATAPLVETTYLITLL